MRETRSSGKRALFLQLQISDSEHSAASEFPNSAKRYCSENAAVSVTAAQNALATLQQSRYLSGEF